MQTHLSIDQFVGKEKKNHLTDDIVSQLMFILVWKKNCFDQRFCQKLTLTSPELGGVQLAHYPTACSQFQLSELQQKKGGGAKEKVE